MVRRVATLSFWATFTLAMLGVLSLTQLLWGSGQRRELSIEDRVDAQEAIDRVYYSHQIGARRPFEEAVPRALMEKKVRTYLKQSAALEIFWKTPVTDQALEKELERISSGSRFPERLEEIYNALGRDDLLIRECLARPVLVDRLSRNFFATDERIHSAARQEADDIRQRLLNGSLDPAGEHPRREVLELARARPKEQRDHGDPASGMASLGQGDGRRILQLDTEEFTRRRARFPGSIGTIGPVTEERGAFVIEVLLAEKAGWLRIASYRVSKIPWDEWWAGVEGRYGAAEEQPVRPPRRGLLPMTASGLLGTSDTPAPIRAPLPDPSAGSPACVPDDTWDNGILDDEPIARYGHSLVWTGSVVIVWGGQGVTQYLNRGVRYDPVLDTWTPISSIGAPVGREGHSATWTGTSMVIWGGRGDGGGGAVTGGRYELASDTWTPTSTSGAPSGRYFHSTVWTGSEMIVWGGTSGGPVINSGGRYNPQSDTWVATSTTAAPQPRDGHTAVWGNGRMIVWGGFDSSSVSLNTGWQYDPGTDMWSQISQAGAPAPRGQHSAVWAGSHMIIWGGYDYLNNINFDTGARYDPASNTWTPMSAVGAPEARDSHAAVWTGKEMIVWGGEISTMEYDIWLNSGGRYEPQADKWVPMSTVNAPSGRTTSAVWTGSQMIVWGGGLTTGSLNTGGRYSPATDSWTPTSILNAPSASSNPEAVWTGNLMIVWQGSGDVQGSRYDPLTDSWAPTSGISAPSARTGPRAVWTGDLMIVWGGGTASGAVIYLDTGGRYDPITDTWQPTSIANAPAPRGGHEAVWSGNQMIVWGGGDGRTTFKSGGRYDPVADTWLTTSLTGAPQARTDFPAIWTGSEMIVWGGFLSGVGALNSGGRYDPVLDQWRPTTMTAAPAARSSHTAIWTGDEMIVWGGIVSGTSYLDTGGRYSPAGDAWAPTPTTGAPAPRYGHSVVWTGNEMIVWGGGTASGSTNSGGRFSPTTGTWTPTSTLNAPLYTGGAHAIAVWTGSFMIVWAKSYGGRYALGQSVDNDGDGMSECAGDCNDADPEVWSAPAEVQGLTVASIYPTQLAWDSQSASAGPATRYQIVSGTISTTAGLDFSSGSCLQTSSSTDYTDTRPDPPPRVGFWYLVRARNPCGIGTYGAPYRDQAIPVCP